MTNIIKGKSSQKIIPIEINYKKKEKILSIKFSNYTKYTLSAEYLRVSSPSAEVQTHNPETRKFIPGKKYVAISDIEKVGNYAIRIIFNDGHDTGIFSWDYLYELSTNYEKIWKQYLNGIEKKNLSRELG